MKNLLITSVIKQISSVANITALLILLSVPVGAEQRLKMSTTTSTQDSGLLKVLLPPFEKTNNVSTANLLREILFNSVLLLKG